MFGGGAHDREVVSGRVAEEEEEVCNRPQLCLRRQLRLCLLIEQASLPRAPRLWYVLLCMLLCCSL